MNKAQIKQYLIMAAVAAVVIYAFNNVVVVNKALGQKAA